MTRCFPCWEIQDGLGYFNRSSTCHKSGNSKSSRAGLSVIAHTTRPREDKCRDCVVMRKSFLTIWKCFFLSCCKWDDISNKGDIAKWGLEENSNFSISSKSGFSIQMSIVRSKMKHNTTCWYHCEGREK